MSYFTFDVRALTPNDVADITISVTPLNGGNCFLYVGNKVKPVRGVSLVAAV